MGNRYVIAKDKTIIQINSDPNRSTNTCIDCRNTAAKANLDRPTELKAGRDVSSVTWGFRDIRAFLICYGLYKSLGT